MNSIQHLLAMRRCSQKIKASFPMSTRGENLKNIIFACKSPNTKEQIKKQNQSISNLISIQPYKIYSTRSKCEKNPHKISAPIDTNFQSEKCSLWQWVLAIQDRHVLSLMMWIAHVLWSIKFYMRENRQIIRHFEFYFYHADIFYIHFK